ncbi:hypothetical protein MMC12_000727 [Toensbergia leucococca]|nr:hypothetical protein [Toensbergia leucococca]
MSIVAPRRPLATFSFLLPSLLFPVPPASRRHESSARRTTKRLRVKPDPAFKSSFPANPTQNHVVFNPPSSAPSVYQTPAIFLPQNDRRRELLAQAHSHANPYAQSDRPLPPPVREPYEKKYHLGEAEIVEIRRLRTEDPFQWTRAKLAEKYGCSQFFVGIVVQASKERKEQQRQIMENVKEKWGRRKRYAREDRGKRRDMWGRDE